MEALPGGAGGRRRRRAEMRRHCAGPARVGPSMPEPARRVSRAACPTLAGPSSTSMGAEGLFRGRHRHLDLAAEVVELGGHLFEAGVHLVLRSGRVADVLADLHGTELGAAHGAEVGGLERLLGQALVVEFPGRLGSEAEVELVFPTELDAAACQA